MFHSRYAFTRICPESGQAETSNSALISGASKKKKLCQYNYILRKMRCAVKPVKLCRQGQFMDHIFYKLN